MRVRELAWRRATPLAVVLVAGLVTGLVAGCSSGSSGTASSVATTSAATAGSTASLAGASLSPTATASASGSSTPSPTGLAGDPYDRGPKAGAVLAVWGVAAGHTLAMRAGPGTDQATVVALAGLTHGLVATGRARSLAGVIWYELRFGAQTGWSSAHYLVWLADPSDVTSTVAPALGQHPAKTMTDLGQAVARIRAPQSNPADVVVTGAETLGAVGEVTVDVAGAGDDSVAGQRLHVIGSPVTDGFVLKSVELTMLCSRGLSSGKCV